MVAVVQGRLWEHRPPNEAACALWVFHQVNKDGEEKVVSGSDALSKVG